ncbi:MAG TPA: DUF1778 domain-containing protein [Pseudolabrys sp.]|jgi:uncharacterized protein (DUF1778 family)|nr:DUF1778 domain-containing protein [Pseudolabrys sp.]
MEQRTTAQAKELIEQAACLLGINASEFTVVAAAKMARDTLRDYETTALQPSAHAAFMAAMEATEPTKGLVDLMTLHAEVSKTK